MKQRADRGQAGVAGADAVVALVLEMVEERANQRRVEIVEVELAGLLAGLLLSESEKQTQRVAVGRDRVRARVALPGQPVGEERLWRRLHRRFYPNTQAMRTWDKNSPQIGMLSVVGST